MGHFLCEDGEYENIKHENAGKPWQVPPSKWVSATVLFGKCGRYNEKRSSFLNSFVLPQGVT